MSLSEKDNSILQEIVSAAGQCLSAARCEHCPFRGVCLPEFLGKPLSSEARLDLALRVISHQFLLGEDLTKEDIEKDFLVK